MGFLQEYKAERVMEALKGIIRPSTTVIRDGNLMSIEVREVVPGDILSLEMGDQVPADAEIIDVKNLEIDESQPKAEYARGFYPSKYIQRRLRIKPVDRRFISRRLYPS